MFGQNQSWGGGNQGGGLFGNNSGQNTGFGGLAAQQQPQNTMGGFGQNAGQGSQQSSLFGGGQGNATTGFGGATSGFGQGGLGGQNQGPGFGNTGGQAAFGGFGGQPNASTGGFGGGTGGGLFGNQNKPGSLFGQNTGAIGAAGVAFGGGATSQGFGAAGTGAAGGTSTGFGQQNPGGGLFGAAGNQNQFGGNAANQNQPSTKFFQAPSEQQLCSLNVPFELRRIPLDDGKGQQQTLRYRNIRAEEKYSTCSTQMLRLGDLTASRGAPTDLPEWKAQQEWPQRCQQYPLMHVLQKGAPAQNNAAPRLGGQQAPSSFGGQTSQASSGFGVFGQSQPQPASGPLFGGAQAGAGQSSLFGQNQQNNTIGQPSQGLGAGGFGAQQPQQTTPGGPFGGPGANKPAGQSTLFGGTATGGFGNAPGSQGTSLFGQQNAGNTGIGNSSGGLFGGQVDNNQAGNKPGGLFGGSTGGQAGRGLFGQPAGQTQNNPAGGSASASTGGLFGQQPQPGATGQTGSLFGGQTAAPGGGLFAPPSAGGRPFGQGAAQNAQAPNAGGGLFGNKPSGAEGGLFGGGPGAGGGGGLFGANTQQKSGLFGPPSNAAPSAGLFGQSSAPSTGGLFGGVAAQSQPGGGLFGNTQGTSNSAAAGQATAGAPAGAATQQSQGLFGQAQPPASGQPGLFGGSSAWGGASQPQSTSAGLFGGASHAAPQPQQQQLGHQGPQPSPTPMSNLYLMAAKDPLGLAGLEQENPVASFDDEIDKMKRDAEQFEKAKRGTLSVRTEFGPGGGVTTSVDFGGVPIHHSVSNLLCHRETEADQEEAARYLAKEELKQRSMFRPAHRPAGSQASHQGFRKTFSGPEGYKTAQSVAEGPPGGLRSQGPGLARMRSYNQSALSNNEFNAKRAQEALESPFMAARPLGGADGEPVPPASSSKAAPQAADRGLLDLRITLKHGEKQHTLDLSAHKSRDVSEILRRVKKWFIAEVRPRDQMGEAAGPGSHLKDFQLMHKSACLGPEQSLEEVGITEDCELEAIFLSSLPERAPRRQQKAEEGQIDSSAPAEGHEGKQLLESEERCDPNLLPKCPRPGYKTIPTLEELRGMTDGQLRALPKFTVHNAHGKIEFHPKDAAAGVDVTEVDLMDVEILPREVVVYGRSEKHGGKPAIGAKLNVPATITLKNVSPPAGATPEQWEAKLKANLARSSKANAEAGDDGEAEFLAFDHSSHDWIFRVPHFTKWGIGDDEEKEDSRQEEAEPPFQGVMPSAVDSIVVGAAKLEEEKEDRQVDLSMKVTTSRVVRPQARYGSAGYQQKCATDAEDFIELSGSRFGLPDTVLPPETNKFMTERYKRQKGIMKRIKLRKSMLQGPRNLPEARPTNVQMADLLQGALGVPPRPQHFAVQGARPCFRPCTGPDGNNSSQLLTLHTTNLRENPEDTSTKMALVLHNLPVDHSTDLPNQMEALLSNIEILKAADDDVPRQDLAAAMPETVHHCGPADICKLLHRIALDFIPHLQRTPAAPAGSKLNHEFYLVCMLNALFGDPRLHLIKLHPSYGQTAAMHTGPRGGQQTRPGHVEFEKMQEFLKSKPFEDSKQSAGTSKIRKNAVTELLRFVCQVEHQVAVDGRGDDDRVYSQAYHMLLNGDVRSATRFLSQKGKHNLAMCLSQSVSASNQQKAQIINYATLSDVASNSLPSYSSIINLISAHRCDQLVAGQASAGRTLSWQQLLCSLLLYVCDPQLSLAEVLKEFLASPAASSLSTSPRTGDQDLLLVLLELYVSDQLPGQQAENKINKMDKVRASKHSSRTQDFAMPWLSQYVIKLYNTFEEMENAREDQGSGLVLREQRGIVKVADYCFDALTVKYADQLAREQNFELALTLCLFLKDKTLQQSFTTKLVGLVAGAMRTSTHENKLKMERTLHEVLGLPPAILLGHVACANFSNANYNAAVGQYLAIGDANAALQTFCGHLCPLYFGSPALIHQLKIQRAPVDLAMMNKIVQRGDEANESEAPPGFRSSGARNYVEHLLQRLLAAQDAVRPEHGAQLQQLEVLVEALRVLDGCQLLLLREGGNGSEEASKWLSAITSLIGRAEQATPAQDSMKLVFTALVQALHQLKEQLSSISFAPPPQRPVFLAGGFQMLRCDAAEAPPGGDAPMLA